MPGYIHGLVQVKLSILVKDRVRAGRGRAGGGQRELAGLAAPGLLPAQTIASWEQDWLWPDAATTPKLKTSVTGSLGDTQVLVSTLVASLSGLREFISPVPVPVPVPCTTRRLGQ